jgi:hypothetical protein
VEIADSARKHGVSDEDILHATRNALRAVPGIGWVLIIGADRDGSSCSRVRGMVIRTAHPSGLRRRPPVSPDPCPRPDGECDSGGRNNADQREPQA